MKIEITVDGGNMTATVRNNDELANVSNTRISVMDKGAHYFSEEPVFKDIVMDFVDELTASINDMKKDIIPVLPKEGVTLDKKETDKSKKGVLMRLTGYSTSEPLFVLLTQDSSIGLALVDHECEDFSHVKTWDIATEQLIKTIDERYEDVGYTTLPIRL